MPKVLKVRNIGKNMQIPFDAENRPFEGISISFDIYIKDPLKTSVSACFGFGVCCNKQMFIPLQCRKSSISAVFRYLPE